MADDSGFQTNRSYTYFDKLSNISNVAQSQATQISQLQTTRKDAKSEMNIKSLTDFINNSSVRNRKILNLTSRTGFWSNQNAMFTATLSNLPTKPQLQKIAQIDRSLEQNSKKLKEELEGTIYNAERFNDSQNQLNEVENLEKWLYDHTESLKRELITGSRKKLQNYGNKYEQKLRMPELNLDVLNIMTKRDQKRQ